MPFDLSIWKVMVVGLVAAIVFGPDKLPQLAKDAGRTLRQLRVMLKDARSGLEDQLGPEIASMDLTMLNPKTFVRRHLLEDDPLGLQAFDDRATPAAVAQSPAPPAATALREGEPAPYDVDAT